MANPDPCGAILPKPSGMEWRCLRTAKHVLHPGKYARQHMDMKTSPTMYWDVTDEEIANYKARLTNGT